MPRTAAKVMEADIARAIRAMKKAGLAIGRIEIQTTGVVTIHAVGSSFEPGTSTADEVNEWDVVLKGKS